MIWTLLVIPGLVFMLILRGGAMRATVHPESALSADPTLRPSNDEGLVETVSQQPTTN